VSEMCKLSHLAMTPSVSLNEALAHAGGPRGWAVVGAQGEGGPPGGSEVDTA